MTVISVEPKYSGLSGNGELEGVREYTKVFIVRTDSTADGVMTVGNALGLPRKGTVYTWQGEVDPGALCWSVTPRQLPESQNVWEVTCEFSSDMRGGVGGPLGGDPRYDVDNPLLAPPEVTWGHWVETEVVSEDIHGNPIVNSAGCPYVPPLTRERKQRSVIVIKNESTYPVSIDQGYSGAVNSDTFYGWLPWTAKLEDVTATAHFAQAQMYWRVRYEIRFRKPDWKRRVLSAGAQYFVEDSTTGLLKTNTDGTLKLFNAEDDGIYSTNPVLLDLLGTRISQDDILAGNVYWQTYELDPTKAFAALNL